MNQIQVCRSPGAWPRGVESALRAHAQPVCPAATPPALPSMATHMCCMDTHACMLAARRRGWAPVLSHGTQPSQVAGRGRRGGGPRGRARRGRAAACSCDR